MAERVRTLKADESLCSLMMRRSVEIFVKEISIEQKQSISRVRSNCKKHKLLQEASWRRERDRIGWHLERVDGRGQSSEAG